jgi:long-chain acyl-CoA synthetase
MTVGDIGHVDTEGYLFLSDRRTDMIIAGGVNIYPAEVENVLSAHPAVADVAVIGVPDQEYGESVTAIVVPVSGVIATEALARELRAWCRARLAGFKTPRTVEFRAALARTETGKLAKRALREPYWAGQGRRI